MFEGKLLRAHGRNLKALARQWNCRPRRWFESQADYREAVLRYVLERPMPTERGIAWQLMDAIPAVRGVNIVTDTPPSGFAAMTITAQVAWWRRFVPGSRARIRAAIIRLLPDIQPCGTAARVVVR